MDNKKDRMLSHVGMWSITTVGQMLSDHDRNNKTITELRTPQITEFMQLRRRNKDEHVDRM